MVLHKKYHVLKTIRDAVLSGDSLSQAKSLCLHSGFSEKQINDTLALFDEFIESVNLWSIILSRLHGNLASFD